MAVFSAIPTATAEAFRRGAPDAFGNEPEHAISPGPGTPCRHCLKNIPEGEAMLVLAYKPFEGTHAYSEVGPIFLCAKACERGGGHDLPPVLTTTPDYLIKGYSSDERIVYGTGVVTLTSELEARLDTIFADPDVAYIHVRSARNNCYQARVDRG